MTEEKPTEVVPVDDPIVGLPIQCLVAVMLSQGLVELTVPKAMLEQAVTKLFTVRFDVDGGFTVRLHRA